MAASLTATAADPTVGSASPAKEASQTGLERHLLPFASGLAILLASLVNFLIFNDYPLLRADVLIVAGGMAGACALMALLYPGQRPLVRAAMEGFLVGLVVDLNADGEILAVGAGVATMLFVFFARKSILPFALIIGITIIVTSILGLGTRQPWIETRQLTPETRGQTSPLPAIVHIILDEHIGIEGLPATNPESRAMKAELRSFYEERGFAVFGRAYSEHMHTVNAIPDILNYGNRGGTGASKTGVRVGKTMHFGRLRAQGYRLHLFQSNFADFCTDASSATCTTYIDSSLRPTLQVPLSAPERARLIAVKFAALSSLAKKIYGAAYLERMSLTSSVAAFAAAPRFAEQVRHAKRGEVYFAHLLIPHYPYVTNRDCRFLATSQWRQRMGTVPIREREAAYFEQLRCTTQQIDSILDAIAKSPAGGDAIVIVHGDHGSRVTNVDPQVANQGYFTEADLIAGYSTIFAVRSKGIAPGYREKPAKVSRLLEVVSRNNFHALPTDEAESDSSVMLDDDNWKPRARVPLPASW